MKKMNQSDGARLFTIQKEWEGLMLELAACKPCHEFNIIAEINRLNRERNEIMIRLERGKK